MMTPWQKYNAINSLKKSIEALEGMQTTTPCKDCASFSPNKYCSYWNQVVPDEHRDKGCDKFYFSPDSIPF